MGNENILPELGFLKHIFLLESWKIYEKRITMLRSGNPRNWSEIDFPVEISFELTNHCNLKCVMCPTPSLKRARGYMTETLFKRVARDISDKKGFLFLPQGFGELLLHKKLLGLLDIAFKLKIGPIVVLTNAMLLNEINLTKLLNLVDVIVVTIDGVTAKTYESIRVGGRLSVITHNIERLLEMRGGMQRPHLVLRIIKMKETEGEIDSFRDFWSGRIGSGDIIQVADFNNWTDTVPHRGINDVGSKGERTPCRMLWKNLSVYYDGRVSPCCYDAEGELIVGNVLEQNLKEIWHGSSLKKVREIHLRHQFQKTPICSRCNSWF